ncbi:MAG: ligand-binding sensor domain-containing protein, partial [Aggregatilineales bacterium]
MINPPRLGNSKQLDIDLDAKFHQQLQEWELATGQKYRTLLLEITSYFFAEKRKQPNLKPDTVTKMLQQKRPIRPDGLYNAFTWLGVLYTFGGIKDLDAIKTFVHDFGLKIPSDMKEDEVYQRIQEGAERARQALPGLIAAKRDKKPEISNHRVAPPLKKRFPLIAAGAIAIILMSVFGIYTYLHNLSSATTPSQVSPIDALSMCSAPVPAAAPIFLHDQGFSIFQSSTDKPTSAVLTNSIRSIGINAQGVWIGYIPDGKTDDISYYDTATVNNQPINRWTHCPGLRLRQGQTINGFAFTNDSVFVAIDRGNPYPNDAGVARLSKSGWTFYTLDDGLPSSVVYSVQTDENSAVWATTNQGVAKLEGNYWKIIYQAPNNGLASNEVDRFLKDKNGNAWFALVNRGISRLRPDGQWVSYYTDTPGLQNVRAIVEDDQGGVWFATDGGGLLRFKDEQWATFTVSSNHLPSDNVQDVERDKFGRIWIATNGGVAYTSDDGQTWTLHSNMNSLAIQFGCSGCMYDDNHLWLVLKDQGIGHVRIPPLTPTVRFVSPPPPVKLNPGEHYIFKIGVEVVAEKLDKIQNGDALYSSDPNGTNLYGAYPIVEMTQAT